MSRVPRRGLRSWDAADRPHPDRAALNRATVGGGRCRCDTGAVRSSNSDSAQTNRNENHPAHKKTLSLDNCLPEAADARRTVSRW